MKLISMTDFVLEKTVEKEIQKKGVTNSLLRIKKYAEFLKQLLELWMLVPCELINGKWIVLKKPKISCASCDKCTCSEAYHKEYEQAKDKVLFEGFEYVESQAKATLLGLELSVSPYTEKGDFYITKKEKKVYRTWFKLPDIESLVQCGLTLKVSF